MPSYTKYFDGTAESLPIDHIARPGNDTVVGMNQTVDGHGDGAGIYTAARGEIITKVKAVGNGNGDATVSLWSINANTSATADIMVGDDLEDADEITGPFSKVQFTSLKGLIWVRKGA